MVYDLSEDSKTISIVVIHPRMTAYNLDVLILELQAIRKQMKPSLLDRIPCLFKGKKFQTNRCKIE